MKKNILAKMADIATDFDVAAGVGESLLNNFFAVHYQTEHPKTSNVYKGAGEITSLKISYAYDIQKPASIDLTPIADFKSVYKRHLLRQPEILASKTKDNKMVDFLDSTPPNVKIFIPSIKLTITFQPSTSPAPISIDLNYSFTVTGFADISSSNQIQITPIDATVGDPQALNTQIQHFKKNVIKAQAAGDNCYDYEELIKYIINQTISDRISAFVVSFPLPTPINLFDTVNLSSVKLTIDENYINITANADPVASILENSLINPDALYDTHQTKLLADSVNKTITDQVSSSGKALEVKKIKENASETPAINKGLYLMFSNKFFQIMASKFININESKENCGSWTIFDGCSSYFLKLNNAQTQISGNELEVKFDFSGGGGLKARAHLHCITTPWVSIGASVTAVPNGQFKGNFYIDNTSKALFISAGPKPFALIWNVNFIWPISEIADILLDFITNAGELIISLIGVRFHRQLTKFPDKFPGTSFSYTTDLDNQIVNINGNLAIMGDITFTP